MTVQRSREFLCTRLRVMRVRVEVNILLDLLLELLQMIIGLMVQLEQQGSGDTYSNVDRNS